MKRHKMVNLCPITWELANKKSNFSEWVRNKLREERNKAVKIWKYCSICDTSQHTSGQMCGNKHCSEYLFHHLEDLE